MRSLLVRVLVVIAAAIGVSLVPSAAHAAPYWTTYAAVGSTTGKVCSGTVTLWPNVYANRCLGRVYYNATVSQRAHYDYRVYTFIQNNSASRTMRVENWLVPFPGDFRSLGTCANRTFAANTQAVCVSDPYTWYTAPYNTFRGFSRVWWSTNNDGYTGTQANPNP